MKTYKTWEMIRELTENPDKQFISNKGANDEEIAYVSTKGHAIIFETTNEKLENGNPQISVISRIQNWEEVKEPVDFMTTIKSGKHVGVEYPGVKYEGRVYGEINYKS